MQTLSKRELVVWHPSRNRAGEYRRDGAGNRTKRAKINVDGRVGGFYGIGSTFEEADAALKTFTNPECVCFPEETNACKIHPDVKIKYDEMKFELPALECRFVGFEPDHERWPSSGENNDGTVDMDMLNDWGWR